MDPIEINIANVVERILGKEELALFPALRDLAAERKTLMVVKAPYNAWRWLAKRTWSRLTPECISEIRSATGLVLIKQAPGPKRHASARVHKDGQVARTAAKLMESNGHMAIARDGEDVLFAAFW